MKKILLALLLSCPVACGGGGGGGGGGSADAPFVPVAVFVGSEIANGPDELFATDGSRIVKLSGALVPGGNVGGFRVSPDGTRVAFRADKEEDHLYELYVVSTSGGETVKVSGPMPLDGDVWNNSDFRWSPDGSRIAYIADQEVAEVHELFTVTPTGEGNVKVSGALALGGDVVDFAWAPDGSRIAYRADQNVDGTSEIFSSLPDGGGNVRVSGPMVANGDAQNFAWAPDSSRIAYFADQTLDGARELYTSAPDGGSNVRVSGTLVANGDVIAFEWSPDGTRLVYRADQIVDEKYELFVSLAGSQSSIRVSHSSLSATADVKDEAWAPDGSRIAYRTHDSSTNSGALYACLPTGAGSWTLPGAIDDFRWSPDSSRIAFRMGGLYTVAAAGGSPVQVSLPGVVASFEWNPESTRIAYHDGAQIVVAFADGSAGATAVETTTLADFRWAGGKILALVPIGNLVALRREGELLSGACDVSKY